MNKPNKKFINKKRKITRENEDETAENILEENKSIMDQIAMLSQKQNLIY